MKKFSIPSAFIIAFALIGVVIMGYLVSLHYSEEAGAFCNLGEGLSCDIVNKSIYSEVLGIPVSILGLLYFLGVLGLVIWRGNKAPYQWIFLLSLIALGPSLYLSGVEIWILKNICVYCEVSKALIAAITVTAFVAAPKKRITAVHIGIAIVFAALLGWATYAFHSSIVPSGKYDTFAQCVDAAGMKMYGSQGCSFCAKQRAMFGDAFRYVTEIECDPRFPGAETELCVEKNIAHTPTWIREDRAGNTITRFDPGVLSLEIIAQETGCALP